MSKTTRILSTMAQIDDIGAMTPLLAPIRNLDKVSELLDKREAGFASEYDEEARTARYIVTDAWTVMCFSVTDVSRDEAASVFAECRKMTEWGYDEFQTAAARALGGSFQRVQ
jgi:hypothetical protein